MPCDKCSKRTIIVFTCRCGKEFCSKHRYPESHDCTFDYVGHGKKKLAKDNPAVGAQKVAEI